MPDYEGIREVVNSRRFEQVTGTVCMVLGLLLFVAPFVFVSGATSTVLVMWFVGAFLVIVGALFTSESSPIGEGGRFQA